MTRARNRTPCTTCGALAHDHCAPGKRTIAHIPASERSRARYDEACPRPGSGGYHSDSYGDDGDGHCRFCGASPAPPEQRPADFFASLPAGTVVELRDPEGRQAWFETATLTVKRPDGA